MKDNRSNLYDRLTRLRFQVPVLALLLVLAHQTVEHTILASLPRWQHFATQVLFYGLVGPILAWFALSSLRRSARETEEAEKALKQAHSQTTLANRRLELLIDVNHRLGEAEDEETLLEAILELPQKVVPSIGSTLIRFDDRGQPLPAIHEGDLDPAKFQSWADHLSSPNVRSSCECCTEFGADAQRDCPVLRSVPPSLPVERVVCLPLERAEHTFGILNIFLPTSSVVSQEEATLLDAMATEISLAMESMALRSRELDALYRLQRLRSLTDLHSDLAMMLSGTIGALEVTGGAVYLTADGSNDLQVVALDGQSPEQTSPAMLGLLKGALEAADPIVITDMQVEDAETNARSLVLSPLTDGEGPAGVLLLWSDQPDAFSRRRTRVAEMVATQQSLIIENYRLYSRVEHQAALEERARLAREIHDGIAQMLGYLKLRTSQLMSWADADRVEDVRSGLVEVSEMIDDAYTDAREAIDGLRLKTGDGGIAEWQDQAIEDFSHLSGIHIEADRPPELILSPEANAQLLRIVQEALGNVRKHSGASQASLRWSIDEEWLVLRIKDDGNGFHPDQVLPISRHGLETMRERADLLSADFQITSRPGNGAEVSLRMPVASIQADGRGA